jgi:hypothetical protein
MRQLSPTLLTTQRDAPFAAPGVRVRIRNRRATVLIQEWGLVYEDDTPTGPHDCYSAADADLFQLRIDPADHKLYTRHIDDPSDLESPSQVGYTTPYPNPSTVVGDKKIVCKIPFPDATTINFLTVYCDAVNPGTSVKAVIYSDNDGAPDALLGTSDEYADLPQSDDWYTFTFSTPVEIPAGTDVWLGVITSDNIHVYCTTGDTDQRARAADTYADGPEDPFGEIEYSSALKFSVYASTAPPQDWTDSGKTALACATRGHGDFVVAAYIDNASPYHVWYAESEDGGDSFGAWTDSGMVSDANGKVAIAVKDADNFVLLYTRGTQVYAREYDDAGWLAEVAASYTFTSITGLSAHYSIDYNFLITGEDADTQPGFWAAIFGDGFNQPAHTFGNPNDISVEPATTAYAYQAPFLDKPDTYRATVVQHYAATIDQYNQLATNITITPSFAEHLWREPFPTDAADQYGAAICHSTNYFFKTTPDGIWIASRTLTTWDISNDVLELKQDDHPLRFTSSLRLVLDNTGGKYNTFSKLGYEIEIGWGYLTAAGWEYSEAPHFWITGWKFVSPPWFPLRSFWPVGVIGTLEIAAQGVYDMMRRWRTPRDLDWSDGASSPFQMLSRLCARVGFELVNQPPTDPNLTEGAPLTVNAGTTALSVIKRIISWLDISLRQGNYELFLFTPAADDESVYTYDNIYSVSHLLFRGNYQYLSQDPNQAQVWGDAVMAEQYDVAAIAKQEARLTRVTAPAYTDEGDAQDRATGELRKGVWKKKKGGWVQTTVNCGTEIGDVVTITDTTSGINAQRFRVLGMSTHYRKVYWIFQQVLELGEV